jgi:uncharacterized protein (TIGR00269 family)
MQCNKCRRNAVLFQEYSGQHLCEHHVDAYVEAKAKHEIRRNRWILPGDHVAVVLTGNPGSTALLYFLKKLTCLRRDIKISAIAIDEGITGYHDSGTATRIAESLETECFTGSFLETFGVTLYEIARRKGAGSSCTYCRVFRNFLLNRIAKEQGVTKLASGDTLDDDAAYVLEHILGGTPEILIHTERTPGIIPTIRPFITLPLNEVILYAGFHDLKYEQSTCPYMNNDVENDVRTLLNGFTLRHPATKYALHNLGIHINEDCATMANAVSACERCGEPADGICQSCRILSEVTVHGA